MQAIRARLPFDAATGTGLAWALWMGRRLGLLTFLCIVLISQSQMRTFASRGYIIDSWDIEMGLPGGTVTSILQTRDGYLWLGTFHGLVRFDGLHFRHFTASNSTLQNHRIICLYEDREGELWLGTEGGGLVRFAGGQFEALTVAQGLSHDVVLAIGQDGAGTLWAGTLTGVNSIQDGRIGSVLTEEGSSPGQIRALHTDAAGTLWMVSSSELYQLDRETLVAHPAFLPPGHETILTVQSGGREPFWVGSSAGLVRIQDRQAVEVPLGTPESNLDVRDICLARNGDLWLGTHRGLFRIRDGNVTRYGLEDGLPSLEIRCVSQDSEGNLWVGSNGGGLSRLKPRLVETLTARDGLSHNIVMGLHEDREGRIWAGLNCGGINIFSEGVFKRFRPAELNVANSCVWTILGDASGTTWFGTWGGGLGRVQGTELKWLGIEAGLSDSAVLALCPDAEGGLWIGTYGGGVNYLRDGVLSHFGASEGLFDHYISSIVQMRDGTVWVGSNGSGLARFDGTRFERVELGAAGPGRFVRALHEDRTGALWIGTGGNGLGRFKEGRFHRFSIREGLPTEVVSQILEDDDGHLWIGSNRGIFRIALDEFDLVQQNPGARLSPIVFGKGDGMEAVECTANFHPSGLKTRDGRLWFSTVKGIAIIDPSRIEARRDPVPVVIERVRLGETELEFLSLSESQRQPVEIAPATRRLQIFFTALTFASPERTRFRYQLEGLDRAWVEAGQDRVATYTGLPPGEYRFVVGASAADGSWSAQTAWVRLRVGAPFWASWWFLGGVTVTACSSLAGIGWFASKRAFRRKMETLEQENALERERARIAKDIHDDLGASLTEIALQTELSQRQLNDPKALSERLFKISKRARLAVQSMDEIVWALNPRNDTLDHVVEYICQYVDEFAELAELRCWQDVPQIVPAEPISAEMRHHLFLVVKEALNNIVKHSKASQVWLRVAFKLPSLEITIRDDGQGLDPARVGRGNGLGNMRKRIEELEGSFLVESQPESGTQIFLRVRIRTGRSSPA